MKVRIDELVGGEPKREHGDIKELKQSIEEVGLINPITINQNKKVLAGRRRLQAITELGFREVECRIIESKNDLFDFKVAIEENIKRKNLTDTEVAIAIKEYDEMKRQIEGIKHAGGDSIYKKNVNAWTQGKTAKDLGIKQQQVAQSIQIAKAVEEYPELAKEKGAVVLRHYNQKKDTEAIEKKAFPVIEGKFKTILADPPWNYSVNLLGRTKPEYNVLDFDKLKALEIERYAEKNCHLYLWSPNNFLRVALELGKCWGFDYKTCITWIKPSIGIGSYFRNSTEHLLFFVKGHLATRQENIPTHFTAPRGQHSEKPEVSYEIIERASYPAYLELFGRKERKGWVQYGKV